MPSGEIQVIVMVKNNIYPREIQVYTEFLVEVDNLLTSVNEKTRFAPRCLYTSYKPKNMLIFQDMTYKGYKSLARSTQINFDQAFPIMVKIAKLHAVSTVLHDNKPSVMKLYSEGSISNNSQRQDFLVHYRNCAWTLGLVAENEWDNEWKVIADKLKKLSKTIIQKGCDLYTRDENAFNVFNHNDLWVPNILFKFDSNDLIDDILFVDFQLSYFGSPGIDLNFFLYGSLSEDTRVSFMKKLIRHYHETLAETLVKLNYQKKIPTLQDIHVEVLKTGFNSVIAAIAEVPLVMYSGDNEKLEMDIILGENKESEEFRYNLFNNPKYKNFIQKLLIEFDDFGYLD